MDLHFKELSDLFSKRGSVFASAVDIEAAQAAAGIAGAYTSPEDEERAAKFVKEARRRDITVLSGVMPTEPAPDPKHERTLEL